MSDKKRAILQLVLVFAGVSMIGMGIWRKETEVIFSKAIKVCLECVGIG